MKKFYSDSVTSSSSTAAQSMKSQKIIFLKKIEIDCKVAMRQSSAGAIHRYVLDDLGEGMMSVHHSLLLCGCVCVIRVCVSVYVGVVVVCGV